MSRITCACYIPGPALPSIPSPPFIPGAFFRALTCVSRLLSSTPHPLSPSRCIALHRAASRCIAQKHPLLHPVPAVYVDADQHKGEGPGEPWYSPTQKPVDRSPLSRILLGRIKRHVELLLAHICHRWYVGKEIPSNHAQCLSVFRV